MERIAIAGPVLDAVGLVRHRAEKQGVAIALCGAESAAGAPSAAEQRARDALRALPPIEGDAHGLAQVVLNLLVNALDALEPRAPGGRIDVCARVEGRELELTVRDDGPGVPPGELPRIADLYYTTKEVGRGSGLGLAIVHNVVAAHGGRVELSSPPGAGLAVAIYLPLPAGDERGGRP
jgi:signal transduction histidine kinase